MLSSNLNNILAPSKFIEHVENILKIKKYIRGRQTLKTFLKKDYATLKPAIMDAANILDTRDMSERLGILSVGSWIVFSDVFYHFNNTSTDHIVKLNSGYLREEFNNRIVIELNKYIMDILKWDLNRRTFRSDDVRIAFYNKVISDIQKELAGEKEDLVNKYVSLVMNYGLHIFDNSIKSMSDEEAKAFEKGKQGLAQTRNQLADLLKTDAISSLFDSKTEAAFVTILAPVIEQFLSGFILSSNRFDYLLYAFVSAQSDFKDYVLKTQLKFSKNQANDLLSCLESEDITGLVRIVHSFFASLPNQLLKNNIEAYYHINMHMMLKAIGSNLTSELSVNNGRIDSVVELDQMIYIIEYKLDHNSDVALSQIEEKKYYESFMTKGKRIMLLGISFDSSKRNIKKEFSLKEMSL